MKKFIFAALILGLLSVFQTFASDKAEIDKKAPEFTLTDVNGKTHKLSDYKGKIVVLEWINYDCPFVKKHYDSKNMQKIQEEYTKKGIVWLAICSSAPEKQGNYSKEEIKKRIKETGSKMSAYLIDEDGKIGRMYDAKVTPHMYIINKDGVLVYMGAIDSIKSTDKEDIAKAENYVKSALNELLNGKIPTTKVTQPYGCSVKYK